MCEKEHKIYFGIKSDISQTISDINKEDKTRVNELEKDYYLVDKSISVFPAIIKIETEYESPFWYETWVECDVKKFNEMVDAFKNEKGGKIEGKLYDELVPYYQKTKGLNCTVKFLPNMKSTDKPELTITEESSLKRDQKNGISRERLEILMNKIHHKNEGE